MAEGWLRVQSNQEKGYQSQQAIRKNIKKQRRMNGLQYGSAKGRVVPAKTLVLDKFCRYENQCNIKISRKRLSEIHENFYSLQWALKSAHIMGQVVTVDVKKTYTRNDVSRRHRTRDRDVTVCKAYFKDTLLICDGSMPQNGKLAVTLRCKIIEEDTNQLIRAKPRTSLT
ncbi:hypothetical protein HHI36_008011 [Cryptolaemus montrouzieri]|uniref:Uncharacterized protein n=1 Tax=Cryptolaemus montrouzieri TaxID=559131 RepID=A0ABD2MRQ4_9CUCU